MANTSARRDVLSLYRRILHAAKTWEAKSGVQTETTEERRYIKEEARTCFKENKSLSNVEQIEECIRKGEARLAIALHYRNPYPRPVNVRPLMFSKSLGKQRK